MKKTCILLILILSLIPISSLSEKNDIHAIETDLINHTFSENCYGRFYIPSVDINVALYTTVNGDHRSQDIVDAQDSAAYRISHHGGCGFIADHWNQGFINIKNVEIGDYSYVYKRETNDIITYECIYSCYGSNDGDEIYFQYNDEYTCMQKVDWADFVVYTCNGNWTNVYMRFFAQIDND